MDKTGKKLIKDVNDVLLDFSEPLEITVRADNEMFEVLVSRPAVIGQVLLLLYNAYEKTLEQVKTEIDKEDKAGYTNSSVIH